MSMKEFVSVPCGSMAPVALAHAGRHASNHSLSWSSGGAAAFWTRISAGRVMTGELRRNPGGPGRADYTMCGGRSEGGGERNEWYHIARGEGRG